MGSWSLLSAHILSHYNFAYIYRVYSQRPHLLMEYLNCFIVVQVETICNFVTIQHMQMIYDYNYHYSVLKLLFSVTVIKNVLCSTHINWKTSLSLYLISNANTYIIRVLVQTYIYSRYVLV